MPDVRNPDRRRFLLASAGATAALSAAPYARAVTPPAPAAGRARPARNAIFMVADGMSAGTLTLADMLRRARDGRPARWVELWKSPGVRRGTMATFSADSHVTDSAAAASAWGIGRRVNNETVNITPDGRSPEPILVRARAAGRATGLVTTTRITHATPAGFIANVPHRGLENDIAAQLLERRVDVALGGGAKHFPAELLAKRPDLRVVRTREELLAAAAHAGPVLGLFKDSHMSYSLDRPATEPTLAEMARHALAKLDAHPDGFVLQIEGGRVDQGGHNNDAGAMLFDMLAFDDAVATVAEFAADRDDTLVVITTDHATGNPGLTFYGQAGVARFERLQHVTRSFEWISAQAAALPRDQRPAALPALIEQATGVGLSAEDVAILTRRQSGERVDPFLPANGTHPVLGSLLANHLGVSFVSPNHTSDYVEVTAMGPGSQTLPPMLDNTELHDLLVRTLDLPPAA